MPFPHHDPYWQAVADYLDAGGLKAHPLTAPTEFNEVASVVYPYEETFAVPTPDTPVVVVHKGMLPGIHPEYLGRVRGEMAPTFANEVFVVFSGLPGLEPVPETSLHVQALNQALATLPAAPPEGSRLSRPAQPKAAFGSLTVEQVRAEMNRRYERFGDADPFGGYEHPYPWDQARFAEVNRIFAALIGSVVGQRVLEIGCGIGRNVSMVAGCREYLGTDLSDVAIAKARRRFADCPHLAFRQMDAMNLTLPDAAFDLVLGVEIVEHVQDPERMLREVFRVLAPDGRFLFNSANRDSLHLRVVRALGLPEYRSTHEHFREFGFTEMVGMLREAGFVVDASTGIFLQPYLNLPTVGEGIQAVTRTDPDLVAVLCELGRRVGPEYGYEFAVSACKPKN